MIGGRRALGNLGNKVGVLNQKSLVGMARIGNKVNNVVGTQEAPFGSFSPLASSAQLSVALLRVHSWPCAS